MKKWTAGDIIGALEGVPVEINSNTEFVRVADLNHFLETGGDVDYATPDCLCQVLNRKAVR